MKQSIMFGVLFSTALAVGVGAQATGGQTPTQPGSSDQSQVTVTGCLQSGDAGGATGTSGAGSTGAGSTGAGSTASGAAGAAASGAARGGFVLTNAKMGSPSAGSGGASSTGTAGSATGSTTPSGMAAGMTRIKLEGSQSDMQKYANSQVEVRGKLERSTGTGSTGATSGATGSAGATGSGAGATGSASGPRQDVPTLQVTSVRQVSPTCSGS